MCIYSFNRKSFQSFEAIFLPVVKKTVKKGIGLDQGSQSVGHELLAGASITGVQGFTRVSTAGAQGPPCTSTVDTCRFTRTSNGCPSHKTIPSSPLLRFGNSGLDDKIISPYYELL